MMLPTHALAGMLLALPVALAAPEFGAVALAAGFAGGVFPDLDMYVGHRKTLHFPTYFAASAAVAAPVALAAPSPVTVGAALFLAAAAVHSASDVLGGGLELRPWEGTSDRAVYDHHRDRWLAPRRWVGYDGSPGDLALSAALAVPLLVAAEGPFRWLVVGSLAVGTAYAAVRRPLAALAERLVPHLVGRLPDHVAARLPPRYRQTGRSA